MQPPKNDYQGRFLHKTLELRDFVSATHPKKRKRNAVQLLHNDKTRELNHL